MISKTPFEEFNKKFDVAGAFIECEGEILMLLRQDGEPQGNKWSSVAGKVERGEIVVDGMAREIKEEAGIDVSPGGLKFLASYYTRYPSIDFVYHLYRIILKKKPEVKIRPDEH